MKNFLTSVDCIYSQRSDDTLSTDDSSTDSCNSSMEDFNTSSAAVAAIPFNESDSVLTTSLKSAVKCEVELSAETDTTTALSKNEETLRNNCVDSLVRMKIAQSKTKKQCRQSIAIFDWDDTLLPTSFIYHKGLDVAKEHPQIRALLAKLDKNVAKILEKATRAAKTCIVTNAMENWVEVSSETYLPLTYEVIKSKKITVISARQQYEEAYPDDPTQWKMQAFSKLGESLDVSAMTNIICLGDNEVEMGAAQALGKKFAKSMVKTLKFKVRPRPEELIKQHEVVLQKFDQIHATLKNLSIKLEKKN